MNTHYCSSCGKKHTYTIEKPKICLCGFDMTKAFANLPPKPVVPSPSTLTFGRPTSQKPNHRRIIPPRGHTPEYLSKLNQESTEEEMEIDESQMEEPNEWVNRDEIHAIAQELAAGLNASDFVVNVEPSNTLTGADILKEAAARRAQSMQSPPVSKPTRKRKKG